MRRHAHVDFQLFSQKSSGIPDTHLSADLSLRYCWHVAGMFSNRQTTTFFRNFCSAFDLSVSVFFSVRSPAYFPAFLFQPQEILRYSWHVAGMLCSRQTATLYFVVSVLPCLIFLTGLFFCPFTCIFSSFSLSAPRDTEVLLACCWDVVQPTNSYFIFCRFCSAMSDLSDRSFLLSIHLRIFQLSSFSPETRCTVMNSQCQSVNDIKLFVHSIKHVQSII